MKKSHSIPMLAAIIASHYGARKVSAFTAADTALKLTSLANAIVRNEEWYCNGFKTEYHDAMMARMSAADRNVLAHRLNTEGPITYEKTRLAQLRKLARILADAELPADDVKYVGLYGGLVFVAGGREFAIAN